MAAIISELDPRKKNMEWVVEEISRLERRIFPKHESLSKSLNEELGKKNNGLLYMKIGREEEVGGEEEEEIVGYVMYSWISSLCASITKLAVKENHRKQGHGKALMEAAIRKCRTKRIQRICLHVDPTRTAAFSLYKMLGFQIDDTIKQYYSSTRDAYRMFLEFD